MTDIEALPWMPFYPGDYLADTMHLTAEQHGCYMMLICRYWLTRKPLPDDDAQLAAVCRMTLKAWSKHASTIRSFFTAADGLLRHKRIDFELQKARDQREFQRARGRKGAAARWGERGVEEILEASLKDAPPPPSSPLPEDTYVSSAEGMGEAQAPLPDCPYKMLIAIYAERLPMLIQPRIWEGKRRKAMQARWKWVCARIMKEHAPESTAALHDRAIRFFDDYFTMVSESRLVLGFAKDGGTGWRPTLDWLVNQDNFQKVIDGNYSN